MLCTFTISDGRSVVIPSDDIKAIEDHRTEPGMSFLVWMIGTESQERIIKGTATENRDRILREELDQIGTVELHRYQTQQLLQAQPVPRGRQAK